MSFSNSAPSFVNNFCIPQESPIKTVNHYMTQKWPELEVKILYALCKILTETEVHVTLHLEIMNLLL